MIYGKHYIFEYSFSYSLTYVIIIRCMKIFILKEDVDRINLLNILYV